MKLKRSSGLLLHITSLPGPFGTGTLGQEAYDFADFCARSGFAYWQVLPLSPVTSTFGYSPYSSHSAFALNPLFLSLVDCCNRDWYKGPELPQSWSAGHVEFQKVTDLHKQYLPLIFQDFLEYSSHEERKAFETFKQHESWWLDDYALFELIAREQKTLNWLSWPRELKNREPRALQSITETRFDQIELEKFIQFTLHVQWNRLREYCNNRGISLLGDIPIYVTMDSVDAWTGREILQLSQDSGKPEFIAGVPPDYFSETGQRWGNPLYRWFSRGTKLNSKTINWWAKRIKKLSHMVDLVRIDHFRGFAGYWAIPESCPTAIEGEWLTGPGSAFFREIKKINGEIPLVAEDLGIITDDVTHLRKSFDLPGMKILQFAFDGKPENPYLTHTITDPNTVLYTGTHDNNTTIGWYYGSEIDNETRERVREYIGSDNQEWMHWKLIRHTMSSVAHLVIFPVQDILGLGKESRMNRPGTSNGNWRWKLESKQLSLELRSSLLRMNHIYGRISSIE